MVVASESKQLKLIRKIDSILGSSYSLHKVIRKIYYEIAKVMDTSNFYIAIYHRAEDTVTFEVYTIFGKETPVASRKLAKGMTEHVIRTKKPLLIRNYIRRACRKMGIKPHGKMAKCWLGVPMLYKNNVEGVIAIQDYKKADIYSESDVLFLQSIASRAAVVIANTRLIEEEVKRAKELAMMNRIAHQLTRSLDIGAICRSVTKSIIKYFKDFNVAVMIREKDEFVLREASTGYRLGVSRKGLRVKSNTGIIGRTAKLGRTIIANDVTKVPYYIHFGPSLTRSELAVPIKVNQHVIGILDIQARELNAFNDNTVRVLELITDRLSAAIANARLYEDTKNSAKELSVSFAIAQSLISTLELGDVLKQILAVINDTFGYTNCAILLIDKKKNSLYIKAAHGYTNYVTKSIDLSIRKKQGITSHVAATGKILYAPDVFKVPFYVMGKRSVRSEAAIPLKIRDEVIGVLDVESDRLNAFSEKDLRMFSVFATQAAIAIENARLFDETKILSLTDGLTKIANRRHFDLTVESEVRKARGYSRSISLAMIDLDNFKHFNDRFGHQAGDRMLINIARVLTESIRDTDFVARYGGEEFVIVFPETGNEAAIRVSERIRRKVEDCVVYVKGLGKKCTTVSIGVATYPYNAQDVAELVYNADKALYRAKQLGKNRVETLMPSVINNFPDLTDKGQRRR
jgi:diguanylate cyclase (GGDEF)-like protein